MLCLKVLYWRNIFSATKQNSSISFIPALVLEWDLLSARVPLHCCRTVPGSAWSYCAYLQKAYLLLLPSVCKFFFRKSVPFVILSFTATVLLSLGSMLKLETFYIGIDLVNSRTCCFYAALTSWICFLCRLPCLWAFCRSVQQWYTM